jgi:hypothetical protein
VRRCIALALALAVGAGCYKRTGFHCQSSDQCTLGAGRGVCEANGYCSFGDTTCTTGRRYGVFADGRSGMCVGDGDGGGGPVTDLAGSDLARPVCAVLPPLTQQDLNAVYGTSAGDVWIVGGTSAVIHCAGPGSCTKLPLDASKTLRGVWASGPNDVWAGGDYTIHCTGPDACSPFTTTTGFIADALYGISSHEVWFGGSINYSNSSLTKCTSPSTCSTYNLPYSGMRGLWVGAANALCFAMQQGLVCCTGPQTCSIVQSGEYGPVWASSPGDIWANVYDNNNYNITHCTGLTAGSCSMFSMGPQVASNVSSFYTAISGTGPGDVWLGGNGGTVVHCTGPSAGQCTVVRAPSAAEPFPPSSMRAAGPNEAWAVGNMGTILHCVGGQCARPQVSCSTMANLASVWVSELGDVWAVGSGGTVLFIRGPL